MCITFGELHNFSVNSSSSTIFIDLAQKAEEVIYVVVMTIISTWGSQIVMVGWDFGEGNNFIGSTTKPES